MISYRPLWETMRRQNATTYTLRVKGGVSGSTLLRLQAGESVSTHTLDALCKLLGCGLPDIAEYLPEPDTPDMPDTPDTRTK